MNTTLYIRCIIILMIETFIDSSYKSNHFVFISASSTLKIFPPLYPTPKLIFDKVAR